MGTDQVSKQLVRNHLELGYSQSFLGDTLRLTHTENAGAFLSMGAALSHTTRVVLFQVGVGVIVVVLLIFALFWQRAGTAITLAYTLLAASGLGNLIDRVMYDGRVTDFLNVGLGSLRTGIFNVADVVGVTGVILLFYKEFKASTSASKDTPKDRVQDR